jgi:predicted transposase YdaD
LKNKPEPQPYDNTLKALFGKDANQIIPYLLPGAEFVGNLRDEERNIEINRSMLKADLVHRISYKRLRAMLNLELQTKDDPGLLLRLLQYHVALYEKHKVPVISVILYLFQTAVQLPPYQLSCADEALLTFHYKVICLWELDAQPIVKNHIIALYTLLPAMQGAYPDLLKQALDEIVQSYSRYEIGSHILRFHRIMWRSQTMSHQDKLEIEEALHMQYHFDEFIDENPVVLDRIAQGEARGKIEGKIEGLQEAILNILHIRFSALATTAQTQQTISHTHNLEKLKQLQRDLLLASDEQAARALLESADQEDLL